VWRLDSRQPIPPARPLQSLPRVGPGCATVELDEETIERLDSLRADEESYDELVTEFIEIYEAEELTPFHAGDEY